LFFLLVELSERERHEAKLDRAFPIAAHLRFFNCNGGLADVPANWQNE
jgi:hypothetical protein